MINICIYVINNIFFIKKITNSLVILIVKKKYSHIFPPTCLLLKTISIVFNYRFLWFQITNLLYFSIFPRCTILYATNR